MTPLGFPVEPEVKSMYMSPPRVSGGTKLPPSPSMDTGITPGKSAAAGNSDPPHSTRCTSAVSSMYCTRCLGNSGKKGT